MESLAASSRRYSWPKAVWNVVVFEARKLRWLTALLLLFIIFMQPALAESDERFFRGFLGLGLSVLFLLGSYRLANGSEFIKPRPWWRRSRVSRPPKAALWTVPALKPTSVLGALIFSSSSSAVRFGPIRKRDRGNLIQLTYYEN